MIDDIYRTLAQHLDAIPNGFPPTESGVELRLLARLFTPQEAVLASVMRLTPEPSAQIGARVGLAPEEAHRALKEMARKGLIEASREGRELRFGLLPFAIGFYEAQGSRLDAELATLVEQYFQEIKGGAISGHSPPLHRVIPVGEAVPADLDILPYQRASDIVEGAKAWGVIGCICRRQQKLVGKGCQRPADNCLVYAPVEGAFDRSHSVRAISKEEALRVLREAEEAGLVHTTMNHQAPANYICNCCSCCCGVLRGLTEFGQPAAVAHSGFQATVDQTLCVGCGDCVERCPTGAISLQDDVSTVQAQRCIGCGLCVAACSSGALSLCPRPESERIPPPADLADWLAQRAQARGILLRDIL
jgi:electron transport complex protein RnfB